MKDQKDIVRELNELKIINAAEQVFAHYGFKGATTERISKQAGLPKANIHYYFKTKTRLYHRVLQRILDEWMVAAQAFENHTEPHIVLRQYVEAKMEFSRLRPFASKVWANEVIHGASMVSEFLETIMQRWLEDKVKVVRAWIDSGKIKAVDPKALFYMIWATTQHYADFSRQIEILNQQQAFSDEQYQQKTDQVVELILASVGLDKHNLAES